MLIACLGGVVGVLMVSAPTVEEFISNPDIGVELSKGQQILFGRHPHIDIDTTVYGPGIFYTSAAAQKVADRRLVGSVAVIMLGYLAAYGLIGWVVLRRSVLPWTFVCWAVLALGSIPRFYKYHIVLPQALVLVALDVGAGTRSPRRAGAILGFGCTLAAMFRVDIGCYGMIAAMALLACRSRSCGPREILEGFAVFAAACVVTAAPYLVFLVINGDLVRMVIVAVADAGGVARGLALPLPEFVPGSSMLQYPNRTVLAFWGLLLVPGMVAVATVWDRRESGPNGLGSREFTVAACLFAALVFLQASHRTDFGHILQAMPAGVAAAILGADRWINQRTAPWRWIAAGASLAVVCGATILIAPKQLTSVDTYSPSRIAGVASGWNDRVDDVIAGAALVPGKNNLGYVIRRVVTMTDHDDAVLFLPYIPQAYFFSGRHFVARTGWLNPGRFIVPGSDAAMVESLGETRVVVDQPAFSFDHDELRNARSYAPQLMRRIYSYFGIVQVIAPYVILGRGAVVVNQHGVFRFDLAPAPRLTGVIPVSPGPAWASKLLSHVNTLSVEAIGGSLVIPWGGGLLLDLDRGAPPPEVDPRSLGVALVGAEGVWSVRNEGAEIRVSMLGPWQLIDTRALKPGRYQVLFFVASEEDRHRRPNPESAVVYSSEFNLEIRGRGVGWQTDDS